MAAHARGEHELAACAVLVGGPMPDWTLGEILAVHFRMHQAEVALFRDALIRAAGACGLRVAVIPEKLLTEHAQRTLAIPVAALIRQLHIFLNSLVDKS